MPLLSLVCWSLTDCFLGYYRILFFFFSRVEQKNQTHCLFYYCVSSEFALCVSVGVGAGMKSIKHKA